MGDHEGWIHIVERFGIGTAVLAVIFVMAGYVLRRLFAERNGILTAVGKQHIEYLQTTQRAIGELVESSQQSANANTLTSETLTALQIRHEDPDSPFSTMRLMKAAVHAEEILRHACKKAGCYEECRNALDGIKRELTV